MKRSGRRSTHLLPLSSRPCPPTPFRLRLPEIRGYRKVMMWPRLSYCTALLFCITFWTLTSAVDRSKFRKCSDTSFCRHFRDVKETKEHYQIDDSSVERTNGIFTAKIMGGPAELYNEPLNLVVSTFESGSARVRITDTAQRWEVYYSTYILRYT